MSEIRLQEFITSLTQLSKRVQNNVSASLYMDTQTLIGELKDRSPVDKDVFRRNWRQSRPKKEAGVIASTRIANFTPYAMALDEGAKKGGAPWYFPRGKAKGGTKSKSGKLILANGRVWAGGLSPSGFVIGGISEKIITSRRCHELAKNLADAVIGAI